MSWSVQHLNMAVTVHVIKYNSKRAELKAVIWSEFAKLINCIDHCIPHVLTHGQTTIWNILLTCAECTNRHTDFVTNSYWAVQLSTSCYKQMKFLVPHNHTWILYITQSISTSFIACSGFSACAGLKVCMINPTALTSSLCMLSSSGGVCFLFVSLSFPPCSHW